MNQSNLSKIIHNNHVNYKYFIEKTFESGIVLLGWEVKAIRLKLVTIDKSYVSFKDSEAYIYNAFCQVPLKMDKSIYNPIRIRKLLLKKKELIFLKNQISKHGYTIIVLGLFWKNSWIKANIGVAKGKKKYDKRNIIATDAWKKEKIYITQHINK